MFKIVYQKCTGSLPFLTTNQQLETWRLSCLAVHKVEFPSFVGAMTGQKRPLSETPIVAAQLLWIYHLVIESSRHYLLQPLANIIALA